MTIFIRASKQVFRFIIMLDQDPEAQQDCDLYDDCLSKAPKCEEKEPQTYQAMDIDHLLEQIYLESSEKNEITCTHIEWTLMLYSLCGFKEETFFSVIDQGQTGRKMIHYQQGYQPIAEQGQCGICCQAGITLNNSCGHSFCEQCWSGVLRTNHTDRNSYELFPICPCGGCFARVNLLLMHIVWKTDPTLQLAFERLLSHKYCQKSDKIKVCPRSSCNRVIYINLELDRQVICECGQHLCRICGEQEHFPLHCGDTESWSRLMTDLRQQQKQLLQKSFNYQPFLQECPKCKCLIYKDGGCLHLKCFCGFHFCWICLQEWIGHESFYLCNMVSQEQHTRKLKREQRQTRLRDLLPIFTLLNIEHQIEKFTKKVRIMKGIRCSQLGQYFIFTIDIDKFQQIKITLIKIYQILARNCIYKYFQKNPALQNKLSDLQHLASNLYAQIFGKIQNQDRDLQRMHPAMRRTRNLLENKPIINDILQSIKKLIKEVKELAT